MTSTFISFLLFPQRCLSHFNVRLSVLEKRSSAPETLPRSRKLQSAGVTYAYLRFRKLRAGTNIYVSTVILNIYISYNAGVLIVSGHLFSLGYLLLQNIPQLHFTRRMYLKGTYYGNRCPDENRCCYPMDVRDESGCHSLGSC